MSVSADGSGVVSHVGSRLLADVAAAAGVPAAFDAAAGGRRQRRSAHTPGRVLTDLAVLLADGGETITDLAVLRHQPNLFGPVASTATAWRVLDAVDDTALDELKRARAVARERPGCCMPSRETVRSLIRPKNGFPTMATRAPSPGHQGEAVRGLLDPDQ